MVKFTWIIKLTKLLLVTMALSACQTAEISEISKVAEQNTLSKALLTNPSAKISMQLEKIVSELLNRKNIKLSDNVFAEKSTVLIEKSSMKDQQGRLINGREQMPLVNSITLLSDNKQCYLQENNHKEIITLPSNIGCKVNSN